MSYLSRENAPISAGLWKQIDEAVVTAARRVYTGRRFLHLYGPLGIGVQSVAVDDADSLNETSDDGIITTSGRKFMELPVLYEDFTLSARELESGSRLGLPTDLSAAARSAEECARREDRLIYFGSAAAGSDGLLTAPGTGKIKKGDWKTGENAFADLSAGIESLTMKGFYGPYALTLSPDLYLQLQRLQPGTGVLEIDRIEKLLGGTVFQTPVLGSGKAVLTCPDAANIDLAVGQDLAAAYLEQKDLNHHFRVLETALPRIKRKKSVVVFE